MVYSVAQCTEKLTAISTKKTDYNNAREKVKTAKETCSSDISSITTTVNKIKGDLLDMKKDNYFEGKLANKVTKDIASFKEDMDSAKDKAEKLTGAADSQIAEIDSKIADLDIDKELWDGRLASAKAALLAQ